MGFNVSSDLSAALSSMLTIGGGQVIECFSQTLNKTGFGRISTVQRNLQGNFPPNMAVGAAAFGGGFPSVPRMPDPSLPSSQT
jgi:hypothetical protein